MVQILGDEEETMVTVRQSKKNKRIKVFETPGSIAAREAALTKPASPEVIKAREAGVPTEAFLPPENTRAENQALRNDPTRQAISSEGQKIIRERGEQIAQEVRGENIQPITQPAQTPQRSNIDIAGSLLFGNILEENPITGEARIDERTGQPVQTATGTLPIVPAAAISSIPLFSKTIVDNAATVSKFGKGIFSTKFLLTGGAIGTALKLQLGTQQGVLSSSLGTMSDIITELKAGTISETQARIAYQRNKQNILNAQEALNTLTAVKPVNFILGSDDTIIKFQEAQDFYLPQLDREFEEAVIASRLSSSLGVNINE